MRILKDYANGPSAGPSPARGSPRRDPLRRSQPETREAQCPFRGPLLLASKAARKSSVALRRSIRRPSCCWCHDRWPPRAIRDESIRRIRESARPVLQSSSSDGLTKVSRFEIFDGLRGGFCRSAPPFLTRCPAIRMEYVWIEQYFRDWIYFFLNFILHADNRQP